LVGQFFRQFQGFRKSDFYRYVGEKVIEFFHAHCFEHEFYVFLGCGNVMPGKFSRKLIRVISERRWLAA